MTNADEETEDSDSSSEEETNDDQAKTADNDTEKQTTLLEQTDGQTSKSEASKTLDNLKENAGKMGKKKKKKKERKKDRSDKNRSKQVIDLLLFVVFERVQCDSKQMFL